MILNLSTRKTLQIQTPEGVVFNLAVAGLYTRFLAWAIDNAAIATLSTAIGMLTAFLAVLSPDFAKAIFVISYFALSVGYGIFTEWHWRGQSWGKRLLHLRVVDASGLKLQFSQIIIRNLLRPVDLLPGLYFLGGIISYISMHGQRLGDLAANTVVIRIPETLALNTQGLKESKYNSFRDYPHLEARLRQRVSATEAGLALDAILRRDEMEPEARVELFRKIAGHFRSVVKFDEHVNETITDEQFVRNAIASIYRQARFANRSSEPKKSLRE
jgi:uncharacterized RDD family membrane protein YckC